LISLNKIEYPEPNILLNLNQLQALANEYADIFSWIEPCEVVLRFPNKLRYGRMRGSIVMAYFEAELDESDGSLYECVVGFNHESFLTVGHLLHELAHMKDIGHGDVFQKHLKYLVDYWGRRYHDA
jgi:hypothetical protein